jgi:hypothetical protein
VLLVFFEIQKSTKTIEGEKWKTNSKVLSDLGCGTVSEKAIGPLSFVRTRKFIARPSGFFHYEAIRTQKKKKDEIILLF